MLAVASCDPIEEDSHLIESFDHTAPAYVMFAQSIKGVCAASGSLVSALNFNEWLTAPDTESRWEVEDRYYTYHKIRQTQENLWDIYDNYNSEQYFLCEGQTLDQEGAVWELRKNPRFFYASEAHGTTTVEHLGEGVYEICFHGAPICIASRPYESLYSYLHNWGNSTRARLSATLTIATNNAEFRSGESPLLHFVIEGSGELYDDTNRYEVQFDIEQPLHLSFEESGLLATNSTGMGAMSITNSLSESVDVTISSYNATVVDYRHDSGNTYRGYYDWNGASITPR